VKFGDALAYPRQAKHIMTKSGVRAIKTFWFYKLDIFKTTSLKHSVFLFAIANKNTKNTAMGTRGGRVY